MGILKERDKYGAEFVEEKEKKRWIMRNWQERRKGARRKKIGIRKVQEGERNNYSFLKIMKNE